MPTRSWSVVPVPSGLSPGAQAFTSGPLCVLVSHDAGRWHLSISCASRYPTWDETADARYDLLPDGIDVACMLPPRGDYVNLNPYTFHLWEIHDAGVPIARGVAMIRTHEDGRSVL